MLTRAQTALYWREWSKAKAVMEQTRGELFTASQANEARYACHEQAGVKTSSKDLGNYTFDLVLSAFFSWSHTADIDPQLRQIDQPVTRCRHAVDDLCTRVHAELIKQERIEDAEKLNEGEPRDNYVAFLLSRAAKGKKQANPQDYTVQTWTKVLSMMTFRLNQVAKQGGAKGFRQGAKSRPAAKAKKAEAQPTEFTFDTAPRPATPNVDSPQCNRMATATTPTDNPF
jgi:hypothetical protein